MQIGLWLAFRSVVHPVKSATHRGIHTQAGSSSIHSSNHAFRSLHSTSRWTRHLASFRGQCNTHLRDHSRKYPVQMIHRRGIQGKSSPEDKYRPIDEAQDRILDAYMPAVNTSESYTFISDLQMHPYRYRSWNLCIRPQFRPVKISNNDYTPSASNTTQQLPKIETPYRDLTGEELVEEILNTRNPLRQFSLMYNYSPRFFFAFLGVSVATAIYYEDYTDGLIFGIDIDKIVHGWITPWIKKFDDPEMVKVVEEDIQMYERAQPHSHHYDNAQDDADFSLEEFHADGHQLSNHSRSRQKSSRSAFQDGDYFTER